LGERKPKGLNRLLRSDKGSMPPIFILSRGVVLYSKYSGGRFAILCGRFAIRHVCYTTTDLGQMRPLTWVLKEVDPVGLHRQSGIHSISGNVGIVNRTPSNSKLHHITKHPSYNVKQEEDPPPWPTEPRA
jgi:hypothetical protein